MAAAKSSFLASHACRKTLHLSILYIYLFFLQVAAATTCTPPQIPSSFTPVQIGVTVENQYVATGAYNYYYFNITDPSADVTIYVTDSSGDSDIYLSETLCYPTKEILSQNTFIYDPPHCVNINTSCTWKSQAFGSDVLTIDSTDPYFSTGVFYMGVYGYYAAHYTVTIYVQINSQICSNPPVVQATDCKFQRFLDIDSFHLPPLLSLKIITTIVIMKIINIDNNSM